MSSPFANYPDEGRKLLGKVDYSLVSCRRGYGHKLQVDTHQTECAYCHQSLVDTYAHWLLMSIDHVVPRAAGKDADISEDYLFDYINCVLCCSGCNGFGSKPKSVRPVKSLAAFVKLRDEIFHAKNEALKKRRQEEIVSYKQQTKDL